VRRIFFCGNESAVNEGGGGILLGDSTGGGAVTLRPVRF